MEQLSIYLPPFAGDYSGACSVLFDFNCLILIQDAACCTRNYVDYDEPRWDRTKRTTLCAQLRTMDAVLGRDDKLISKAVQAAGELHPDFIALMGGPVPAVIGTDFPGIAREVEAQTGIPALGLPTTGFSSYTSGIELALSALIDRFTAPPSDKVPDGVNVLGLTPLDFGNTGNERAIRQALEERGFGVVCSFSMGIGLEEVRRAASAQVNLVVSRSGLRAALEMERRFSIPWVAGVPIGTLGADRLAALLRASILDGRSRSFSVASAVPSDIPPLLLIGDQVAANSLRASLLLNGDRRPLAVASFFGLAPQLTLPGDLALESEAHLLRLLKKGAFSGMIADPLITHLPPVRWRWWTSFPHPAVSSNLYWDKVPLIMGDTMDRTLRRWAAERP